MKKLILIIPAVFCIITAKAQSFEFTVQANSGVSRFTGKSTMPTTFLNVASTQQHSGYPNGTGNIFAPDLGAGLQLQYTFKCGFILGGQAGFEQFSSKVNINSVDEPQLYLPYANSYYTPYIPATGHVTDHWDYININPYTGYRFMLKKVKLDVLSGLDIAFGTGSSQTVNVKESGGNYYNRSSLQNYKPATDVRPRLGLAAYYQRFGAVASFSKGLHNYNSGKVSDSTLPTLNTELFRIGLSYRIR